jgi:hypothetical protein
MITEFGVSPWDDKPPPTFDDLNASIRRLTGNELKPCETRWLARTGGNIKLADNFSAGNVFLAGDAAHAIFPLNGQALDSAFQDAINLGWKLIATIRGWAPAGLLSTYHDERYSAAEDMCMNVRAQVALAHKAEVSEDLREIFRDLLQFDEVNKRLAEMILGVDVRYPLADAAPPEGSDPLLGRRFPQALLETASADGCVMRSLQDCRGVLLNLSGIADPSLAEVSSGWKERVDVAAVSDPLPGLAATAVLLRPDAYVVWACALGTAADARLASLHSALTAWFGPRVS